MAKPKNKRTSRKTKEEHILDNVSEPVHDLPVQLTMSVRLPGPLASSGRTCAEKTGISLNALICVALSDYLQNKGYSVHGL